MQFDDSSDPLRFSLFAVVDDARDAEAVREWLAGVASRVPTELGLGDGLEAAKPPICSHFRVPPLGFEPRTFGLKVRCSTS